MADIRFTGFVEDWTKNSPQHPEWGMRVVETHRKKNGDTWETVGRTYRTIKAAYEVDIDFRDFQKGDMVEIVGKESTESSERDGKRYDNLIVKAETVTRHARYESGTSGQGTVPSFAVADEDLPF